MEEQRGNIKGINLETGAWKSESLVAASMYEGFITFIPKNGWGEEECPKAMQKEMMMCERFKVVEIVEDKGHNPRILMK